MSDTSTDNGEKKTPRNGFVELPSREAMTKREQVALRLMQSLIRTAAPTSRRNQKKALAAEAFELADAFIEANTPDATEG